MFYLTTKAKICLFATILICLANLSAIAQSPERVIDEKMLLNLRKDTTLRKDMPDKTFAMNPVTDFDCPDPSIVKIDGWFYCFKIKTYEEKESDVRVATGMLTDVFTKRCDITIHFLWQRFGKILLFTCFFTYFLYLCTQIS